MDALVCYMDELVEDEMYRHYIADTIGVLVNMTSKVNGGDGSYPMYTELLKDAQPEAHKREDPEAIKAHILKALASAGDVHEMNI